MYSRSLHFSDVSQLFLAVGLKYLSACIIQTEIEALTKFDFRGEQWWHQISSRLIHLGSHIMTTLPVNRSVSKYKYPLLYTPILNNLAYFFLFLVTVYQLFSVCCQSVSSNLEVGKIKWPKQLDKKPYSG